MPFCPKCGAQVGDNEKFCQKCGTPKVDPQSQQPRQEPGGFASAAANLNNTNDLTGSFDPADISQNKAMAVLSYIGILVLIPILAAPKSRYARFHANQGLVLFIAEIVWSVLNGIISTILKVILSRTALTYGLYTIAGSLLGLVYVAFIILSIIGIVNAAQDRAKELPLTGKIRFFQ